MEGWGGGESGPRPPRRPGFSQKNFFYNTGGFVILLVMFFIMSIFFCGYLLQGCGNDDIIETAITPMKRI